MSRGDVGALARTLLYEGYLLYPYRPSAVKNRQRFNFGVIYPDAHSRAQDGVEPSLMRTECLVVGAKPTVDIEVRFLHLVTRTVEQRPEGGAGAREVARLEAGGRVYQPWQEAVEREVTLSAPRAVGSPGKHPPSACRVPGHGPARAHLRIERGPGGRRSPAAGGDRARDRGSRPAGRR